MTDQPAAHELPGQRSMTLDELAAAQHNAPLRDISDLAARGVWASEDELEAFLADLVEARRSHTG